MSTNADDSTVAIKEAERRRLLQLPGYPHHRPAEECGVLLSDRIQHYCDKYQLIDPFERENLKPAGYDLTVGRNYSRSGQQLALDDGMELVIGPYQVAIIQTHETLNMPEFLIGRWNIRVKLAYKGLLWVGGAQVDPGFRGHLCCPIYNLSTEPVRLKFRDTIAMIDFVTTTPLGPACKRFDWRSKWLVFREYPLLSSGIEARVSEFKDEIESARKETKDELSKTKSNNDRSLGEINSRIDTFLALVFTVVAVLFAGLGIVATTSPGERSFINPPAWVAAIALYFALRARRPLGAVGEQPWFSRRAVALIIAGAVVIASLAVHSWDARMSYTDLTTAKDRATRALGTADREVEDRRNAIQELRRQSDGRFNALQQELDRLQKTPSK